MAFYQVVLLFLNYCMVVHVAGQSEFDKDVEIIPGKEVSQPHPLDAKYAGLYANDIYGPPVSLKIVVKFIHVLCGKLVCGQFTRTH